MSAKTILIADDDRNFLTAIARQLEQRGLRVVTSVDAYQALAAAVQEPPDLMLLDIRMPAGDGLSVQERMQKLPALRDIPVIYVTGDRSNEVRLAAKRLGAVGLFYKPVSLARLMSFIRVTLGVAGQVAQPAEDQPVRL